MTADRRYACTRRYGGPPTMPNRDLQRSVSGNDERRAATEILRRLETQRSNLNRAAADAPANRYAIMELNQALTQLTALVKSLI